jgi:dipeptidyl aminopeptidase/acylaminoacyl peptidase
MKLKTVLAVFILSLALPLLPQAGVQEIGRWLVLGPAEIQADGAALPAATVDAALAYDFLPVSMLKPEAGAEVGWSPGRQLAWSSAEARFSASARKQAVYLAAYLETRRWLQAGLEVDAAFPLRVYCDGEPLAKAAGEGNKSSYLLSLANGKHLLLVKGILPPQGGAASPAAEGKDKGYSLRASLKNRPAFAGDPLQVSQSPERRTDMKDVLNTVVISDVSVSPDGRRVAVSLSRTPSGGGPVCRWLEVLDTESGRRLFSSQGTGSIAGFQWAGSSRRFSFTREEKEATSLLVFDLDDLSCRPLLAGVADFSDYWWADDGSFLVYATQEAAEKEKPYRRVKAIDDRTSFPERRQVLTLFFPSSGARQPLATAEDDFSQVRVSPDGRTLLLATFREDDKQRPYHRFTLYLYSLPDGRKEKVLDDPWVTDFLWSPDSRRLLLLGGPSAFAGMGSTLPAGVIPNDFDIQAYLFDVRTRKAEALTRGFAPSIDSAFWHPGGGVFLKVTDQQYTRLYRFTPAERKFIRLQTGCDSVASFSCSRGGKAVFSGSGLASPQKLYALELGSGRARVLKDYNREAFANVRFGRSEDWSFKTREGRTIGGYILYPPDFDPARLWPCIVNYYGGTSPVERDFGGRYPKDWYAANGYVVCVLQPSGAVGYGQEFSSAHVNDWGEITSAEVVRGVEELLRTHPFIDNRRVGAIGASYGGFLTELLASKTDLFACLISHAGISALSSYWGAGDWGYGYSAVATANSFPWNRKDIYVGHSPLFMAERVHKPLLLLHGQDDNNVPPGESYQMFTALKLLGREVALVTFPDQQHWIMKYPQRLQWMKTIMAWFDRWLKGQGEWWKELYPD